MKCPKCGRDMKEETRQRGDRPLHLLRGSLRRGQLDQVFLKKDDDRKGFLRQLVGI
jgi:hypothetical protein